MKVYVKIELMIIDVQYCFSKDNFILYVFVYPINKHTVQTQLIEEFHNHFVLLVIKKCIILEW